MVLLGTVIWLSAADASNAQNTSQVREFIDIPPQTLASALRELTKERGLQIVYRSEVVGEIRTAGAMGDLTADDAVGQLLNGTGLTYHYLDDNTITVVAVARDEQGSHSSSAPAKGRTNIFSRLVAFLGSALAGAAALPALAQSTEEPGVALEEVVVTAERRKQDIQATPISVVVLSGDELSKRGIVNLETLARQVPSVTFNDAGTTKFFNIRGIGLAEGSPNSTNGVAIHWDGTYVAQKYVYGDAFFDVANVEVLRGPQGTYSGQNASGGAMYVNSVQPDFDGTSGYAEGLVGMFHRAQMSAGATFQLSDTIAARVAGETEHRGSSFTNLGRSGTPGPGSDFTQPGNLSRFIGRAQLLFKPGDDFDILLMHQAGDRNTDNLPYQRFGVASTSSRTIAYDSQTRLDTSYNRSTAIANYNGLEAFNVRLSMTYHETQHRDARDDDYTTATLYPAIAKGSTSYNIDDHYLTSEFNLISPDNKPFQWTLGGSYLDYVSPSVIQNDRTLSYTYFKTLRKNEAVFGEVGYAFARGVRLKLGGRYNWDEVGFANGGYTATGGQNGTRTSTLTSDELDFGQLTGRAVLDWQMSPSQFLYATVSKGYKPGGTTPAGSHYEAELVINREIGWKASFLGRMLTTSFSAFDMSYQGFQTTYIADINNPTAAVTFNVDGTKIRGIEEQIGLNLGDLHIDGSFSVLDASYGPLQVVQPAGLLGAGTPARVVNLNGREIPYVPEFSGNAGIAYDIQMGNGELTPSLRIDYVGAQWVSFLHAPYQRIPEHTLLHARVTYASSKRWRLAVYADNLLNENYIANVQNFTDGVGAFLVGAPREVGVSLGYKF